MHQFLTDLKFGNGCTKLVDISRDIGELNRGVQKAFREQNYIRLHTRLTSEKQLFVCLFPHLFSTFHIEI